MRIYLETYGCTLNQADSDLIAGMLESAGHKLVPEIEDAEVIILNTCTVKGATENKTIKKIEKYKKCKMIIAGCLGINEKRIRKIKPDAVIVYPGAVKDILNALEDCINSKATTYREIKEKESLKKRATFPILRVAIQEGCTGACYFCQTRFARPELISYNPKRIIQWIKDGVKLGAVEVQLTGMDTGAYGLERKTNLIELLNEIKKINGEFKIRLGMINPLHAKKMIKDLTKILENEKFYKFLHIPVQTGSEKVCKEMNRAHSVKDFEICATELRKEIPEITIATDIIVGYPTETNKDFLQTLDLLKKIKPDVINISKFTPRDGTKAKEMKQLDSKITKQRSEKTAKLCKKITFEKNKKLIGNEYLVWITEKQKDWTGRNEYYKPVVVKEFKGKLGEKIKVKIYDANHSSIFGKIE